MGISLELARAGIRKALATPTLLLIKVYLMLLLGVTAGLLRPHSPVGGEAG